MENLKEIVVNKLETDGILDKIRAQLKTQVYKILESQDPKTKSDAGFSVQSPYYKTEADKNPTLGVCAEIVRDFLAYYKLDYTLQVLVKECSLPTEMPNLKELLSKSGIQMNNEIPVLMQLLNNKPTAIPSKEETQETIIKLKEDNIKQKMPNSKPQDAPTGEHQRNQSPNNEPKKEEKKKDSLDSKKKGNKKEQKIEEPKKEEAFEPLLSKKDKKQSKKEETKKHTKLQAAKEPDKEKEKEREKDSLSSLKGLPTIISKLLR